MTTEAEERIAHVLHSDDLAHGRAFDAFEDMSPESRAWYLDNARAVIAATGAGPDAATVVDALTAFYGEQRDGWSMGKVRRMRAALVAAGFSYTPEATGRTPDGPAFIAQMPPSPETSRRHWSMYFRVCGIEEYMADSADDAGLVAHRDEHNARVHAAAGFSHVPEDRGAPHAVAPTSETGFLEGRIWCGVCRGGIWMDDGGVWRHVAAARDIPEDRGGDFIDEDPHSDRHCAELRAVKGFCFDLECRCDCHAAARDMPEERADGPAIPDDASNLIANVRAARAARDIPEDPGAVSDASAIRALEVYYDDEGQQFDAEGIRRMKAALDAAARDIPEDRADDPAVPDDASKLIANVRAARAARDIPEDIGERDATSDQAFDIGWVQGYEAARAELGAPSGFVDAKPPAVRGIPEDRAEPEGARMRQWAEGQFGAWDKAQERYADGSTAEEAVRAWAARDIPEDPPIGLERQDRG